MTRLCGCARPKAPPLLVRAARCVLTASGSRSVTSRGDVLEATIGAEPRRRSTFDRIGAGDRVNVETPLTVPGTHTVGCPADSAEVSSAMRMTHAGNPFGFLNPIQ